MRGGNPASAEKVNTRDNVISFMTVIIKPSPESSVAFPITLLNPKKFAYTV
jgi:hypothetical protein